MAEDQPKAPPGWYDYDETRQAYWKGERWGEFRPKPGTQPPPGKKSQPERREFTGQVRDWTKRHPVWSVTLITVVGLFVLMIVAATVITAVEGGDQERVDALEQDLDKLAADNEELSNALHQAQRRLDRVQSQEAQAERRAEQQAAAAEEAQAAAEEAEAAAEEPAAAGGTNVEDFAFADVQVREDSLGEFEVRARVTNNGAATDFAFLEATVFSGGSVATVAEALEEFDAGETRTVTFISTDNYEAWDDVEFTVDRG